MQVYGDLVIVINDLKKDNFLLNAFQLATSEKDMDVLMKVYERLKQYSIKTYPNLEVEEISFYLKYCMGILFREIREKEKVMKRSDLAGYTINKYRPIGMLYDEALDKRRTVNEITDSLLHDLLKGKKIDSELLHQINIISNLAIKNNDSSITRFHDAATKVLDVERNEDATVLSEWHKVIEKSTGKIAIGGKK